MFPYKKLPLFLLCLVSLPALAESVVIGETCTTLGATTMASDKTSIAACLQKTEDPESDLIWKAIAGGDMELSKGILCGQAVVHKTTVTYTSSPTVTYQIASRAPCSTYNIVNITANRYGKPAISADCPPNAGLTSISYVTSEGETDRGVKTVKETYHYMCIGQ